MPKMTEEEAYAFIGELPARTAKVAVVEADGAPHVTPVWVVVDGRDLVFTTHRTSRKGKALRRDPRVSITFDDDRPMFSFVIVEGTAELTDGVDDLLRWTTAIAGRYMGDELAERYGRRNAVEGEMLVRVTPSRLVAARDIAA
jgi:PPOX class probable F420-dependent enzyme